MVITLLYFLRILIKQKHESSLGAHFCWPWPVLPPFHLGFRTWAKAALGAQLLHKCNPWPMRPTRQAHATPMFSHSEVLISVKHPGTNTHHADSWKVYLRAQSRPTACSLLGLANPSARNDHLMAFPSQWGRQGAPPIRSISSSPSLSSV